ncbi:MAG: choice-of-anchor D domain-containing protein [Bacteroidota bacterium]
MRINPYFAWREKSGDITFKRISMRYFSFLIFFTIAHCTSFAQPARLEVLKVDTSQFPTMKAKFYAFDKDGKAISNSSGDSYKVSENGIERPINQVLCPAPKPHENISLTIGINVSASMGYSDNGATPPLEIAKATAMGFARTLDLPRDEMAIQTSNERPVINIDFTADRTRILNAIEPLKASGRYISKAQFQSYLQFVSYPTGLLPIAKEGRNKRVAVLCTDAESPMFDPWDLKYYKDTCLKYNIRFYAIICSRPEDERYDIRKSLQSLAEATGGQVFDGVSTVAQAERLVMEIQEMIQNEPCEIQWQSASACDTLRTVQFEFPAYSAQTQSMYTAPASSLVSLQINSPSIGIGGVRPGSFKDTSITITALKSPISVSNISSSNAAFSITDFGGNPPPFVLKENEKRVLKIRFSPVDSMRISAAFKIENDACDNTAIFVSGGYPGKLLVDQTLRVTYPNGGEVLLAGSDTTIRWEGLAEGDIASVEYTTNNGKTWRTLTQNSDSLSYRWHVPDSAGNQCRIRVKHYSNQGPAWARKTPQQLYGNKMLMDGAGNMYTLYNHFITKYSNDGNVLWEKIFIPISVSNSAHIYSTAMALDSSGNILLTGAYGWGNLNFGNGVTLSSTSYSNLFIAKFNSQGVALWARKAEGDPLFSSQSTFNISIASEKDGHIWIAASFSSFSLDSLTFESGEIITTPDTVSFYRGSFLIRYDPAGKLKVAKQLAIGESKVTSIIVDHISNIIVFGEIGSSTLDFGNGILLSNTGWTDVFIAKFEPDGNPIWAKNPTGNTTDHATAIAIDKSDNIYIAGDFFSQNLDFGSGVVLPRRDGNYSYYIAKYNTEGRAVWARELKGSSDDIIDLATDAADNLYLCGNLVTTYKFDFGNGINLKTNSPPDIFIAKYNSSGAALWARKLEGNGHDFINSLVTDPFNNIYINGGFSSPILNFNGGITLTNTKGSSNYEYFIAKYTNLTHDQSDVSDSVFAITIPVLKPGRFDIDMGRIYAGTFKDTIIEGFLTNSGTYPVHIASISVEGGLDYYFKLLSGGGLPFTLQPGEKRTLGFRWLAPQSPRVYSVDIVVYTRSNAYRHTISVESIAPVIALNNVYPVNFGDVGISTSKDTTIAALIRNTGKEAAVFMLNITGPGAEQFELMQNDSIRLEAGEATDLRIRFKPKYFGRTSALISFRYQGGNSSPVVDLFGRGLAGNVSIPHDSGYNGEKRNVRLILSNPAQSGLGYGGGATAFRAKIAYSNYFFKANTALFKEGMTVKTYGDIDTVEIEQLNDFKNSELASIPIEIISGDQITSEIYIASCFMIDSTGRAFALTSQNGSFTILGDISEDVLEEAGQFIVTPNPIREIASLTFKKTEPGLVHVVITDVVGRRMTILNAEYPAGKHSWDFDTHDFSEGVYILTLESDGKVYSQKILIQE